MGTIYNVAKKLADEGNGIEVILAAIMSIEDGAKPPRKGKDGSPRLELERVLDSDHAQAYLDFRQRIRHPLTAYAAKLVAVEFEKCGSAANQACDFAIGKSWRGFEADWYLSKHAPVPYNAVRGSNPPPSAFNDLAVFYRERADAEQQR